MIFRYSYSNSNMGALKNYRFLARYNREFNAQLMDACERIDDAERHRDRGAFFGSIHHTLNHLLIADQIWLKRLRQCSADHGLAQDALAGDVLDLPEGTALGSLVYAQWATLRVKRAQLDAAIEDWLAALPEHFPDLPMRYGNSKGLQREHPAWLAMTHFFNHQTHHRGQVTALLMQAGVDVGVTDLIAWAPPRAEGC